MKKSNKYFIIFLLIFLVSNFFDIKKLDAINSMNEWYQLGTTGNINIVYPSSSPSAGQNVIRNAGATASIFIPTKTDAEVNAFCAVSTANVQATCRACGWGSWYNYSCQSNNVWQTRRSSSMCGYQYSTGGGCTYCTSSETCCNSWEGGCGITCGYYIRNCVSNNLQGWSYVSCAWREGRAECPF